ncbi:hypothetical protein FB45DRAFT_876425 [Roridomyces roridus]|uniref:Uncharacterized protein n=1 Tax=Roridomyces roridus TaxID=1738132 RepID=A0AAD7B3G5_9AGAR|nr:hypothetical protein FB45DRAFT_876425 [Roridomyces roridus]
MWFAGASSLTEIGRSMASSRQIIARALATNDVLGEYMDALGMLDATSPDKTAGDAFETVLGALLQDRPYTILQDWVTTAFQPLILVAQAALDNNKRKMPDLSTIEPRVSKRRRVDHGSNASTTYSSTDPYSFPASTPASLDVGLEFTTLPHARADLDFVLAFLDSVLPAPAPAVAEPCPALANGLTGSKNTPKVAQSVPAQGKENVAP